MAAATPPPPVLEPTQDERTMATLAHALQMVGGWIAPLIIFLIRRQSRFVSFNALKALLLQIAHTIVIAIFVVCWITLIMSTVVRHAGTKPPDFPIAFFWIFPLAWVLIIGVNITIIVIAIVYCIKAGRGEWAEYPVLGRWARRMLKIGPGGTNRA